MSNPKQIREEIAHELTRLRTTLTDANHRALLKEPGAFWTARLIAAIVEEAEYTVCVGALEEQQAALDFIRGLK